MLTSGAQSLTELALCRYPGAEKNTLEDISLFCTLNSRVAVLGPNGAGKSTMIKVLTGELEPGFGTTWRHPNMRVAYVAQHAFHHIEQHLEKTPNEYIRWRYAIGEDRENLSKVTRKVRSAPVSSSWCLIVILLLLVHKHCQQQFISLPAAGLVSCSWLHTLCFQPLLDTCCKRSY